MSAIWPCPNNCDSWCRSCDPRKPQPNHHPKCEHYDASLIDVYRFDLDGSSYVTRHEPTGDEAKEAQESGVIIHRERMHLEVYEQLKEFPGF